MQDGDDIIDPKLSAQYRELADERAPESLNRAVLRVASKRYRLATHRRLAGRTIQACCLYRDGRTQPGGDPGVQRSGHPHAVIPDRRTGARCGQLRQPVFQDAGDTAAEQIREATSAANNAMQNSGSGDVLAEDMSAGSNPVTLLPEDFNCDSAQRRTMTTWWQCIQSLESRGASAAAEQELAELVATFPDFVKPD